MLNQAYFSLKIDAVKRIIHILDLNVYGTKSVTNAIEEIAEKIIKLTGADFENWIWTTYGTDGMVCRYLGEEHGFIPSGIVDAEFYDIMQKVCRK